jgi:succinoglycan biosynthesis protein ExoM
MMTQALRIDIAVCTYRRPQLAETLCSLGALVVPDGVTLRLIVADNDAQPSAEGIVRDMAGRLPFPVAYVHCPASNISLARNACLDHAEADWLAFIDDDCSASPHWLAALVAKARATGADAVLGPVEAIYGDGAPGWMRRGDFHSTNPVFVRGALLTGYTCNVLMNVGAPSLHGRRFNLALGRTGGEDTEFFSGMARDGGRLAFAEDALASELVPADRAQFGWLAKRRFRTGQTHGRLLAKVKDGTSAKAVALAAAKAVFCAGGAIVTSLAPVARNRYVLRAIMHSGVVSGLLGVREIALYGDAPAAIDGRRDHAA